MTLNYGFPAAVVLAALSVATFAQESEQRPKITMGNGEFNAIEVDGLVRKDDAAVVSEVRTDGSNGSIMRSNSTSLTFASVLIEQDGWLVMHPVIDGRPNGDIVAGFAPLTKGLNENVTVKMHHPADAGGNYIVMLHGDTDGDGVFDFVFVEDGINVEDKAIFEGTRMIAHFISLPQ